MKKLFVFFVLSVLAFSVTGQKLYKDVCFGQSKDAAKRLLPDSAFYLEYGSYSLNRIDGVYRKGNLIAVTMMHKQKFGESIASTLTGGMGKDQAQDLLKLFKSSFIEKGYQVTYDNPELKLASASALGNTMGTNYIFAKDSVLVGIDYDCSVNSAAPRDAVSRGDVFSFYIRKTSTAISEADYKWLFGVERKQKRESDVF